MDTLIENNEEKFVYYQFSVNQILLEIKKTIFFKV